MSSKLHQNDDDASPAKGRPENSAAQMASKTTTKQFNSTAIEASSDDLTVDDSGSKKDEVQLSGIDYNATTEPDNGVDNDCDEVSEDEDYDTEQKREGVPSSDLNHAGRRILSRGESFEDRYGDVHRGVIEGYDQKPHRRTDGMVRADFNPDGRGHHRLSDAGNDGCGYLEATLVPTVRQSSPVCFYKKHELKRNRAKTDTVDEGSPRYASRTRPVEKSSYRVDNAVRQRRVEKKRGIDFQSNASNDYHSPLPMLESEGSTSENGATCSVDNWAPIKDHAELLLSLRMNRPELFTKRSAVSLKNIRCIYLTQRSVYKMMHLENLMKKNGWDLTVWNVFLLKNAAVLIAQNDGWRLRRIRSYDANRILLTLEDGFVVSTMEVSDRALEMGENWTNYILDELNHQVERSLLPPIEFSELVETHRRLSLCGAAIREINEGCDASSVLQELAQRIMNPVPNELSEKLEEFVDPLSNAEMRRRSFEHSKMRRFVGEHLKSIFREWTLGHETPVDLESMVIDQSPPPSMKRAFRYAQPAASDPRIRKPRPILKECLEIDERTQAPFPRKLVRLERDRQHAKGILHSGNGCHLRFRDINELHRNVVNNQRAYSSVVDVEKAAQRIENDLRDVQRRSAVVD